MSQSLSIAAGGALHPVLPNIHKMLSMAALEMSLSFFPPRPPKLPAGGHLEDHCAPLGQVVWSRSAHEGSFTQTLLQQPVRWLWKADVKLSWKLLQLSELLSVWKTRIPPSSRLYRQKSL